MKKHDHFRKVFRTFPHFPSVSDLFTLTEVLKYLHLYLWGDFSPFNTHNCPGCVQVTCIAEEQCLVDLVSDLDEPKVHTGGIDGHSWTLSKSNNEPQRAQKSRGQFRASVSFNLTLNETSKNKLTGSLWCWIWQTRLVTTFPGFPPVTIRSKLKHSFSPDKKEAKKINKIHF